MKSVKTYEEWKWLKDKVSDLFNNGPKEPELTKAEKKKKEAEERKRKQEQESAEEAERMRKVDTVRLGGVDAVEIREWYVDEYDALKEVDGWTKSELLNLDKDRKRFNVDYVLNDISKYQAMPILKKYNLESIKVTVTVSLKRNYWTRRKEKDDNEFEFDVDSYLKFDLSEIRNGKRIGEYHTLNYVYNGDERLHTSLNNLIYDMRFKFSRDLYNPPHKKLHLRTEVDNFAKYLSVRLEWVEQVKKAVLDGYHQRVELNKFIRENEFMLDEIAHNIDHTIESSETITLKSEKDEDGFYDRYDDKYQRIGVKVPEPEKGDTELLTDWRWREASSETIWIVVPEIVTHVIKIRTEHDMDFSNNFIITSPMSAIFADINEIENRVKYLDDRLEIRVAVEKELYWDENHNQQARKGRLITIAIQ